MMARELEKGTIVQLDPNIDGHFSGCLLIVSESKSWGVVGYVQSPGIKGQAYYRAKYEDIEPTGGKAVWQVE